MLDRRLFLQEFIELGVDFNGLVIPAREAEGVLARYAFNLFVWNDDPTYKVSLVGSATAIRFNGKYLLLCTNHQLRGVDPERVGMLKDDGSVLVTSGGFRTYRPSEQTDAHDIVAFDFSEPVAAHPELKQRFFDLVEVPPGAPNVHVLAVVLTGYPSLGQVYDLAENNHIGIGRLNVVCLPDGQPSDVACCRSTAHRSARHP